MKILFINTYSFKDHLLSFFFPIRECWNVGTTINNTWSSIQHLGDIYLTISHSVKLQNFNIEPHGQILTFIRLTVLYKRKTIKQSTKQLKLWRKLWRKLNHNNINIALIFFSIRINLSHPMEGLTMFMNNMQIWLILTI